jgi:hypothetical protein
MIADTPDKTVGTMKMPKDMVANPALAQEQFVADSTVKTPVYRGITAMGEYDSEVSFWSPREMGTHVGGKGQAQYMLARGMNTKRAEEELALTSPDSGPVSQRQLDRFFTEELNARGVNDPRMMNLPKAQREMLQEEGMDTSIPELTMMEGYINLKKPLEFATDMSKWSAEYLTTSGSDFLVEAIEQGLGKALTKAQLKKIDMIGAFNNHQFTHKDKITTEIYNVVQTKMLQKFLKSLGFDGFKYKNMVEPNMEGEPTWSYILFDAEQFKSSLATKFDPTDRRMTYNTGGEVEEPVEVSPIGATFWATDYNADASIPLEERIRHYNDAQDIEATELVKEVSGEAVDSGAFDNELKYLGVSKEDMKEGLVNISKPEPSGGQLPKEKQVSSTGAQGIFQVVESTARSVLDNGQVGPKAAAAMGTTLDKLNGMSREELQGFLLNNDKANAIFATAVVIQKLQHSKNN